LCKRRDLCACQKTWIISSHELEVLVRLKIHMCLTRMMIVPIRVHNELRIPARCRRKNTYMRNSDSDIIYSMIADSCINSKKSGEA
jgi:hypothetical protein